MPKTVSMVLDDGLAERLKRFAEDKGFDMSGALDHALRAFLDAEDRARLATEAVVNAARQGQQTATPGLAISDDEMRLWLLSWGSEDERKRPRSC